MNSLKSILLRFEDFTNTVLCSVFDTEVYWTSLMELFAKIIDKKAVNYFCNKFHHRCFEGSKMRLCYFVTNFTELQDRGSCQVFQKITTWILSFNSSWWVLAKFTFKRILQNFQDRFRISFGSCFSARGSCLILYPRDLFSRWNVFLKIRIVLCQLLTKTFIYFH